MTLHKTLLFIILLGFTLSSCSKDDGPTFDELILGEWYITQVTFVDCEDPDDNTSVSLPTNCNGQRCIRLTFQENGIAQTYSKDDSFIQESNGSYSGDENVFTLCENSDCVTGTMDIDGDRAIFNFRLFECNATYVFNR